jgi:3-phosphoshikimate 1-carboxyvinyltransferase
VLARILPGGTVSGEAVVPGDKSVAHRWLILGVTARGQSRLLDLPASLDVRSTALCLATLSPGAEPALEGWARKAAARAEGAGFTWHARSNVTGGATSGSELILEGEGRSGLTGADAALDCGNSGTTLRLLAGVVAASPFRTILTGDESLRSRPMERVADPLRAMGALVVTTEGHSPVVVDGGALRGVRHEMSVPSAQVKSAVLLAGLEAEGRTTVVEPAPTRDHTERALRALGAPVRTDDGQVTVGRFQHEGFEAAVPGDPSSAAFLVAAAALTGSELLVSGVGLNPTRTRFLDVMRRMGVRIQIAVSDERLGEPVGTMRVLAGGALSGTTVDAAELPLVIDEVPVLALLAAHAPGDSWFIGARELRVKESDRLDGIANGIRALGGHGAVEGDDLVVAGGGLLGGRADPLGDHRMAMAFAVAGLAASSPVEVKDAECADVSFPGFLPALRALGAHVEVEET